MNKNELIEKAVIDWQGNFKPVCELVYEYLGPNTYSACEAGALLGKQQVLFTREEFNAAADRMRGKPDWAEVLAKHPEAQYLAQWPVDTGCGTGTNAGLWISYKNEPRCASSGYLVDAESEICYHSKGVLLGDWRNTLEGRPEHIGDANEKVDPLNGYKWGVTHTTNQENPKIDDGIEFWYNNFATGNNGFSTRASEINWHCVNAFKITDPRYKPAEPEPAKPWFESGELPKAGECCEYKFQNPSVSWQPVQVNYISEKHAILTILEDGNECHADGFKAADFRPMRTDKEKAIDFALGKINNSMNRHAAPYIIEQLYDAGLLRLPDQK